MKKFKNVALVLCFLCLGFVFISKIATTTTTELVSDVPFPCIHGVYGARDYYDVTYRITTNGNSDETRSIESKVYRYCGN